MKNNFNEKIIIFLAFHDSNFVLITETRKQLTRKRIGGTHNEGGYGDFYIGRPTGGYILKVGEMYNFFESKGYKFTYRASGHNIWHKNHLPFYYDYMMGMIENQKL